MLGRYELLQLLLNKHKDKLNANSFQQNELLFALAQRIVKNENINVLELFLQQPEFNLNQEFPIEGQKFCLLGFAIKNVNYFKALIPHLKAEHLKNPVLLNLEKQVKCRMHLESFLHTPNLIEILYLLLMEKK